MHEQPRIRSPTLLRIGSSSSVSSLDSEACVPPEEALIYADAGDPLAATRRTRKRFSNTQLMMLEQLYRRTSHPTREQRDALAKEGDMEVRSVTIWFQNKRQMERRAKKPSPRHSYPFHDVSGKTIHTVRRAALLEQERGGSEDQSSPPAGSQSTTPRASHSPSLEPMTPPLLRDATPVHLTARKRSAPTFDRSLSLDRIAARSERPLLPPKTPPPRPRLLPLTPPRWHAPALWESMPSSPPSHSSPQADRDLLDFGRSRLKPIRTLEWACAAARVGGQRNVEREPESDGGLELDLGGDTEDESEAHEAVTPRNSQIMGAYHRRAQAVRMDADKENDPMAKSTLMTGLSTEMDEDDGDVNVRTHDADMMNAALALCGLGAAQQL
ncbi:hypothetical protein IEO21_01223 [Rhodonia placenta]|uniref:Homeobox domain-containing protein n=1 Tax=Rhodonia placenta TaxID=104341 RepID=A0A8H7U624_9APHY|nr:hypothetical protein IEO21_01223 [Postia placenta]